MGVKARSILSRAKGGLGTRPETRRRPEEMGLEGVFVWTEVEGIVGNLQPIRFWKKGAPVLWIRQD